MTQVSLWDANHTSLVDKKLSQRIAHILIFSYIILLNCPTILVVIIFFFNIYAFSNFAQFWYLVIAICSNCVRDFFLFERLGVFISWQYDFLCFYSLKIWDLICVLLPSQVDVWLFDGPTGLLANYSMLVAHPFNPQTNFYLQSFKASNSIMQTFRPKLNKWWNYYKLKSKPSFTTNSMFIEWYIIVGGILWSFKNYLLS